MGNDYKLKSNIKCKKKYNLCTKFAFFFQSFHEQSRIKNAWTKFGFKKAKALANVKENQIEKKTDTQLKKKNATYQKFEKNKTVCIHLDFCLFFFKGMTEKNS